MLWRVCQGIRHFQHATLLHLFRSVSCYTPSLLPRSPVQASCIRCLSTAPMLHLPVDPPQSTPQSDSHDPETIFVKGRGHKPPPARWANPRRYWPQPSSELVDMVDNLFSLRKSESCTAETLKNGANPELLVHMQDREKIRTLAALMVNTAFPRRALQLLFLAHELGYPVKLNAFEAVAYQLAQTKQWEHMSSVVALAKRLCGHTSTRLLNWRARAFIETSHFELLHQVLDGFEEEKIKPTRRTFLLVLSGHLRNRDLANAKSCLDQMERAGYLIDPETQAVIAKAYRSLGADAAVNAAALEALPDLAGNSATSVLNSLLQLALDSDDLKTAYQYLNYFDEEYMGNLPNVIGAAITPADGELVFHSPRVPIIIPPDAATFTILINYLTQKLQIPLALNVAQRMIQSGIRPDNSLAAAVVRAHCRAQDLDSALAIVATMCENLSDALDMLSSFGLQSERPKSAEIFRGLPLTIDILNALLRGILARWRVSGMRPAIRLMRIAGFNPDAETVGVFLSHLYRVERASPRELLTVLKTLSKVTPPTLDHMHIVLRAIHREDIAAMQSRGWWALWMKLRARRHRPKEPWWLWSDPEQIDPAAALDEARSKSPYQHSLQPVIKSLADRQIRADRETVRLRMRRHIIVERDIDRARRDMQTMLDRGMHPTKRHLATIMQGYTLSGDMHEAMRVFRSIREANITPTVDLYTILIAGYARRGKPGSALRVFRDMTLAGVQPDVGSIDALVSAWFAIGAHRQARKILIRMWTHVAPFPEKLREAPTRTLAERFRSLQNKGREELHSSEDKKWRQQRARSGQDRRALLWKLNRLMINWERFLSLRRYKAWKRTRESKSPAKRLSHLSRPSTSREWRVEE